MIPDYNPTLVGLMLLYMNGNKSCSQVLKSGRQQFKWTSVLSLNPSLHTFSPCLFFSFPLQYNYLTTLLVFIPQPAITFFYFYFAIHWVSFQNPKISSLHILPKLLGY